MAPSLFPLLALSLALPAGLAAAQPETVSLDVVPHAFSPNGDGVKDWARINVELAEPARLWLEVGDRDGRAVFTPIAGVSLPRGPIALRWGGHDARVNDGVYVVRARALAGSGATGEARQRVVVDTDPPALRWRHSPAERPTAGTIRLRLGISDRSPRLLVGLRLLDQSGARLQAFRPRPRVTGRLAVDWAPRLGGRPLLPGAYRIAVTAQDDAGNVSASSQQPFIVNRPVRTVVVRRFDGAGPRVALTFDDCNSGPAWASILHTLAARHARATFFCPGRRVLAQPLLARQTVRAGHAVGSHGWDHARLRSRSFGDVRWRLIADRDVWWRLARAAPTPWFRPPYGAVTRRIRAASGSAGYGRLVLWDVDPNDWKQPGAPVVAARVLARVRPGSIVLLHVMPQTAESLPGILSGLARRRLSPVSLPELAAAAGWPRF